MKGPTWRGHGLVFSLIVATLLLGCSDPGPGTETPTGAKPPAPAVLVAPVVKREVVAGNSYVGRTSAVRQVNLVARVEGVLQKMEFTEGTPVKAGQLLFEIEADQYEASVAVARAAISNASASYNKARKYHERLKRVVAGGVSEATMEQAENDLGIAAAQLEQARAELKLRQLDLDHTQIRSPIDGHIGATTVDIGNLVGPSSGVLASIVQLDPIHADFAVSERLFTAFAQQRIASGEGAPELGWFTAHLKLSNGSDYAHDGKLEFVANTFNRSTGSLELRAEFPNPDGLLRPGQFVTVILERGEPQMRSVVPQSSVQQDQSGYYVLVVNGEGEVEQRRITVGDRVDIDWVVESGLEPGEQVIFEGLQKVRPGVKVQATAADPRAGLGSTS